MPSITYHMVMFDQQKKIEIVYLCYRQKMNSLLKYDLRTTKKYVLRLVSVDRLGSVSLTTFASSAKRMRQNSITAEQTSEEEQSDSDGTESSTRDDSSQSTEEEDESSSEEGERMFYFLKVM